MIRNAHGFREATNADKEALLKWLIETQPPTERRMEKLRQAIIEQCGKLKLEPPTDPQVDRLIRSGVSQANEALYAKTEQQLTPEVKQNLDQLLNTDHLDEETGELTKVRSPLHHLRRGAGAVMVETLLTEIEKLKQIEALNLPANLFEGISSHVLHRYRARIAVEELHEIRRHPAAMRYTLLAAYCWQRRREIIDTTVDVLLDLVHRMQVKAERKTDQAVIEEIKRVQGKDRLLYNMAGASIASPEKKVKDVIYPVADTTTLQAVVDEYETEGLYERRFRQKLRSS